MADKYTQKSVCLASAFIARLPSSVPTLLFRAGEERHHNQRDAGEDDSRVQFWDKDHLVAKELQQQLSSSQICCQRNGIIWDVAALYPRDSQWGSSTPAFFGGAVLDVAGDVRQHLSAMSTGR